jgi:hypothetical protein
MKHVVRNACIMLYCNNETYLYGGGPNWQGLKPEDRLSSRRKMASRLTSDETA